MLVFFEKKEEKWYFWLKYQSNFKHQNNQNEISVKTKMKMCENGYCLIDESILMQYVWFSTNWETFSNDRKFFFYPHKMSFTENIFVLKFVQVLISRCLIAFRLLKVKIIALSFLNEQLRTLLPFRSQFIVVNRMYNTIALMTLILMKLHWINFAIHNFWT